MQRSFLLMLFLVLFYFILKGLLIFRVDNRRWNWQHDPPLATAFPPSFAAAKYILGWFAVVSSACSRQIETVVYGRRQTTSYCRRRARKTFSP